MYSTMAVSKLASYMQWKSEGSEFVNTNKPSLKLSVRDVLICALITHKCWVCSGPPVQELFGRIVFRGNQRHGRKETALLPAFFCLLHHFAFDGHDGPLTKALYHKLYPVARCLRGAMTGIISVTNMSLWHWHSMALHNYSNISVLQQYSSIFINKNTQSSTQLMHHFCWLLECFIIPFK